MTNAPDFSPPSPAPPPPTATPPPPEPAPQTSASTEPLALHKKTPPNYPGARFFRLRRYIVAAGLIALVPMTLYSARPFETSPELIRSFHIAAWTLLAFGLLMRTYATLHIAGAKGHKLVTTGPYSMCRHPLYFGSFLCGLGIILMSGAPVCWAAFLIGGVLTYYATIVFEEQRMAVNYPNQVAEFRAQVPMLIPYRLRLSPPEFLPPGLPLLKETTTQAGFILAALGMQLLVWIANVQHLPAVLRLW